LRGSGKQSTSAHLLRHTAATRWLRKGGLMPIAGWKNRDMIDRYTRQRC
jgi:integrase/recombinase XerD